MPVFEATPRKSNLTAQQIKEAERSLFGPPPAENTGFPVQEEKIRTIDLNNPPREEIDANGNVVKDANGHVVYTNTPYRYQEYPRMMYLHGDGAKFLIVQNDAQRQVAEGRGYTAEIAVPEQPEAQQYEPDYGEDDEGNEFEDEQLAGISGPVPGEHEKAPAKKKK